MMVLRISHYVPRRYPTRRVDSFLQEVRMATSTPAAALSPEQVAEYEQWGYLIVREAFGRDEIEALAREADQLLERRELIDVKNIRCRWQNHVETGECLFECFDPVIDIGPVCRRVAHDPRILGPLAAIYGDEACLFKDKLIFKPPGAKGYGLHQDYIGWNDFPRRFVTVLVAIDPADSDNGATEVFPGVSSARLSVANRRRISRGASGQRWTSRPV